MIVLIVLLRMMVMRWIISAPPAMPGPVHQAQQAAWLPSLGAVHAALGILGVKERCAEGFGHPFGSGELSVDPLGSPTKCHRAAELFGGPVDTYRAALKVGNRAECSAGKLPGLEQPLGAGHAEAPLS